MFILSDMTIKPYIQPIRPQQWVKNVFILAPIFFGGYLFDAAVWVQGIITFAAFSLMASSIYCLNDIKDVDADRLHPRKRLRPIASGQVSVQSAWYIFALLVIVAICIPLFCLKANPIATMLVILTYFLLNIAYCLKLKYIAIVDVFTIAAGFVLRLLAGGLAEQITLSPWIVLMTFLIALFLAFAKRRDDVIMNRRGDKVTRKNTLSYNLPFMNVTLGILASVTIVCYILYTVSPEVNYRFHTRFCYISSIFVIAAILRYLQISIVDESSGNPTKMMTTDRFIQVCAAAWILFFLFVIYL